MLLSLGISKWDELPVSDLMTRIYDISSRPLVLIDGAGGSGKTVLAAKLGRCLDANIVATDDVCWCADPIHWDDEVASEIIMPWLAGKNVSYRPTGWIKEERPGSIDVDPQKPLIIEGMGACRKNLRAFATFSIWVDTEPDVARARVIERDLAKGDNGGTLESVAEFTDWWDSVLEPLFVKEEPWKHADVIINGALSDVDSGKMMVQSVSCSKFDSSQGSKMQS